MSNPTFKFITSFLKRQMKDNLINNYKGYVNEYIFLLIRLSTYIETQNSKKIKIKSPAGFEPKNTTCLYSEVRDGTSESCKTLL